MKLIDKISLIIACLLLFEHIGLGLIYQIESIIHKNEIKEKLEQNIVTTTLVFTFKVFEQKTINKKEVLVNGRYFDIKKIIFSSDSVILKGIWDDQETHLKNQVNQIIATGFTAKASKLYPLLFTPCILDKSEFTMIQFNQVMDQYEYYFLGKESLSFILPDIKPPILTYIPLMSA